jgi:O-antigen/teichoic acid export membrane protein
MNPLDTRRTTGNVGNRMMKAAGFVMAGRMMLRLMSLASLMILARLLSPADYGVAALAMIAIGLLQTLSDIRVSQAIVGLEEVTPAHLDTAFTLALIRSLLIAGLLFVGAEHFARFMDEPALTDVLRVLALASLAEGLRNPAFTLYRRNIDFSREVNRQAIATLVSTLVTIGAAVVLRSYWAIVAGTLALRFTETAFTYYRLPYRPRLSLLHWRAFTSFGIWLTLIGISDYVALSAPQFVIGRGLDAARLGLYTIGREISSIATRELADPLKAVIFPGFSAVGNDLGRLRAAYREVQATIFGVTWPVGLGCGMLASQCALILAGPQWLNAAPVIEVLAPTTALLMINSGADSLAVARGRSRAFFGRTLIIALISYPLLLGGLWLGGLMGVVYALGLRNIISVVVTAYFASRLTGDSLLSPIAACWRSLLAGAAMCAALALIERSLSPATTSSGALLQVGPLVVVGASVYAATHALLWLASGKPRGFEARLLELGKSALQRLKSRPTPEPR